MKTSKRSKVWFSSAGVECAAWHYASTNGACVVMAGGSGITKSPAPTSSPLPAAEGPAPRCQPAETQPTRRAARRKASSASMTVSCCSRNGA